MKKPACCEVVLSGVECNEQTGVTLTGVVRNLIPHRPQSIKSLQWQGRCSEGEVEVYYEDFGYELPAGGEQAFKFSRLQCEKGHRLVEGGGVRRFWPAGEKAEMERYLVEIGFWPE